MTTSRNRLGGVIPVAPTAFTDAGDLDLASQRRMTDIPIVVQDSPMSGVSLSAELLARMAREMSNVRYFKLENADAADKMRALLALVGDIVDGPWDGEEGLTLIAHLEAGATGTMPGAVAPEILSEVMRLWAAGDRDAATALHDRWLPLLNWENKHNRAADGQDSDVRGRDHRK